MSTRSLLRRGVWAGVLVTLFAAAGCGGYSSPSSSSNPSSSSSSISQLVPASATAGSAAFTLTVNGSGFGTDAVVYWNGSPRSTTYVSGGQLTAAISAADVSTKASVPVYVFAGGKTSNTMTFTVN